MGISPKSLGISLCFRRSLGRVRPPKESYKSPLEFACLPYSQSLLHVMDMVIFRTIFFELLVFFTFTFLTLHFTY